jgi:hypothetical protein
LSYNGTLKLSFLETVCDEIAPTITDSTLALSLFKNLTDYLSYSVVNASANQILVNVFYSNPDLISYINVIRS